MALVLSDSSSLAGAPDRSEEENGGLDEDVPESVMPATPVPPATGLPRTVVVALGGAGAVVTIAGIRSLDWMIGPVFLALMLVVAVAPAQSWLLRRGTPRRLATAVVLAILYTVLIALVSVIAVSVAQLTNLLPAYAARAGQLLGALQAELAHRGFGPTQITDLVNGIDVNRITDVLTTVLSSLTSIATTLLFLLATVLFMGLDAADFPERLRRISPERPA